MTGYLKWQNSKIFLVNESSEYHIDNIEKINRDDAGYIKFGIGKKWQIAYLNSKRTKCIFLFSEDGIHWEKYPEGPENNHINVNEDSYFIYPHFNSVAILKRQKKLFYIYIDNNWKIFPIPDSINYIDIETDKSFLAVGSKPAVRVYNSKMEIACFQKRKNSDSWNEVPIIMKSWWNASKTIKMGGFDQLQYADTKKIPYVFTSECAWWLDDPSWFLFIKQEDGTFYAHRLKNLQIDYIKRNHKGLPVVFASNVKDYFMLTWSGKKWISHNVGKRIRSYLTPGGYLNGAEIVLTFDFNEKHLLAAGNVYKNEDARFTIILQSNDFGQNWEIIKMYNEKKSLIIRPFINYMNALQ